MREGLAARRPPGELPRSVRLMCARDRGLRAAPSAPPTTESGHDMTNHEGLGHYATGAPVALSDDIWDELLDVDLPEGCKAVAVLRAYLDASSRNEGLFTVACYLFESDR